MARKVTTDNLSGLNDSNLLQNDLSFEADAETLSLFTSIDFDLDEAKVDADVDQVGDAKKSTLLTTDDESDEEEEEEEESADSMVHSVQQANGNFLYAFISGTKLQLNFEFWRQCDLAQVNLDISWRLGDNYL